MPWPFKSKYKKNKKPDYDALPSFTEDKTELVEGDEALPEDLPLPPGVKSLSVDPSSSPVTVTLGAQDRYKKLLERGPEKPGLGRKLGVVAMHFLNNLGTRGPAFDGRTMEKFEDGVLGREHYAEQVARAKDEADAERRQQELEDNKKWREESVQQRREAAEAAREARDAATTAGKEAKDFRTRQEEEHAYQGAGYRLKAEGEQVPPGWEEIKAGSGRTYVRAPKAEREQWQALPPQILEYYMKKGIAVPSGPIDPKTYAQHVETYKNDTNRDNQSADRESEDKRYRDRYSWTEQREEAKTRKAEERDAKKRQDQYKKSLQQAENSYTMAERRLRSDWEKEQADLPPSQRAKSMWEDKGFISRRKALLDSLVDAKNRLAQDAGEATTFPYLDPKTGKPFDQAQPQGQPQSQGQGAKSPATQAQLDAYVKAQVAKGFPAEEAKRNFLQFYEVK